MIKILQQIHHCKTFARKSLSFCKPEIALPVARNDGGGRPLFILSVIVISLLTSCGVKRPLEMPKPEKPTQTQQDNNAQSN